MTDQHRAGPNWPFWVTIAVITAAYLALLLGMLAATATYSSPHHLLHALGSREIQYATGLSIVSCTIAALLSLVVAVPVGYLMSRGRFAGKNTLDTLLDVPIVLPPITPTMQFELDFDFWCDALTQAASNVRETDSIFIVKGTDGQTMHYNGSAQIVSFIQNGNRFDWAVLTAALAGAAFQVRVGAVRAADRGRSYRNELD